MRVLHVINSLSGSGGAEQGMVREITRFGPDVVQMVASLYEPDQLQPMLDEADIESVCLRLSSENSGWNWVGGARRLRRVIEEFQPDVVHSSLASANLIAQISASRAGLPVLSTFTLSGDPVLMSRYQPGAAKMRAQVLRRIERRWARRDHVWFRALTEDARATNVEVAGLDPGHVVVIPRGVPLPDTGSAPSRQSLGLPAAGAILLNVGRQTAQKGHVDLVAAFARIRAEHPAHLVILGREGDGTTPLQQSITDAGLGEHVTVVPYTERPFDYYRTADMFVFPSYMEGLGTAVLEAMASALPVVAYDIPPVREVTAGGSMASLVPVGEVGDLSQAVLGALADPGPFRERAMKARDMVRSDYSVDGVAKRLEDRLRELSAQARRSPRGR